MRPAYTRYTPITRYHNHLQINFLLRKVIPMYALSFIYKHDVHPILIDLLASLLLSNYLNTLVFIQNIGYKHAMGILYLLGGESNRKYITVSMMLGGGGTGGLGLGGGKFQGHPLYETLCNM